MIFDSSFEKAEDDEEEEEDEEETTIIPPLLLSPSSDHLEDISTPNFAKMLPCGKFLVSIDNVVRIYHFDSIDFLG